MTLYVVKYNHGYMARGSRTIVKTKRCAAAYDTIEEAEGRARARYQVHRKPELANWQIEEYKKRS